MNSSNKTHLASLGMLLLSGGGAFAALSSAAGMAIAGIINYLQGSKGFSDSQGLFSLACSAGLIFLLLLPSTILAAIRLLGKPLPALQFTWLFRAASIGLVLVPIFIGSGYLISTNNGLAALLLPWFQLAVVALPLWWMLETGRKNLPSPSSQHKWGLFSFSVTVTMPFILIAKSLLVIEIMAGVFFYLYMSSPQILQELSTTMNRLVNSNMDKEAALRALRPYFSQPGVIYFLIAITAGVIPLLEELLKPLALWFFCARPLSPREGFIGGMICGAAFALLESLGSLASPAAESWTIIAIGRIGTGILHTTASGLVGWGMAKAWSEGKYLSMAGAYLAAVSFHSLWNISALLSGLRELAQFSPDMAQQFESFIQVSPFIMILLAFFLVSVILKANIDLQSGKPRAAN